MIHTRQQLLNCAMPIVIKYHRCWFKVFSWNLCLFEKHLLAPQNKFKISKEVKKSRAFVKKVNVYVALRMPRDFPTFQFSLIQFFIIRRAKNMQHKKFSSFWNSFRSFSYALSDSRTQRLKNLLICVHHYASWLVLIDINWAWIERRTCGYVSLKDIARERRF